MTGRPPSIRSSDVIVPSGAVSSVVVDGQAVLYDEAGSGLHVLDPIGTVVWSCLDGEGTLGEIEADLADVYGVPIRRIRTDIRRLIRRLNRLGLIDGVGGGSSVASDRAPARPADEAGPLTMQEPPNP